ncbi:hypothetical protein RU94_GL001683 [Enterococcus asini]|nr:hypothetical protein RU94_GL001683 [Enterococcus asini]
MWVKLKADGFDDIGAPLKVASPIDCDYMWLHENAEISLTEPQAEKVEARLAEHWNEDMGDVLWWNFPVEEPPYCGTPLDEHFPKYKTHFTTVVMPSEIEKPKRWVIKNTDGDTCYLKRFRIGDDCIDGESSGWIGERVWAFTFDDRAKAEAVALLVEGSVEEV